MMPAMLASRIAIASALAAAFPMVASAQSFQGSGTTVSGNVSISDTAPGQTVVTISSPQAVIDWMPVDASGGPQPIDFQPAGTTASFTSGASAGSFAVLNRILPSQAGRSVALNGTITSTIMGPGGQPQTGGAVYFYSPAGIIVGPSSVIDVGSLGLTTAPPILSSSGGFLDGGSLVLAAAAPGSVIKIQPGARVFARGQSHVLAFAPQVFHGGTIESGQVTALVSADAGTVRFGLDGLVTIEVTAGTSASGTTLAQNGVVTGPANSNPAAPNRIYLVSVARNEAISMALAAGSRTGFEVAGAADAVGNSVVLSGGHDIVAGAVQTAPSPGAGTGAVDVAGNDFVISSALRAEVTGRVAFGSSQVSGLSFASDAVLTGAGDVSLMAQGSGNVLVGRDLTLRSERRNPAPAQTAQAGSAVLAAEDGGLITVLGSAQIISTAVGSQASASQLRGGDAMAGEARLSARNNAVVSVAGDVSLRSAAYGGLAGVTGAGGGDAQAGNAWILANGSSGSRVILGGNLDIKSLGFGGDGHGCTSCVRDGGTGKGTNAAIHAFGGAHEVSVAGTTSLEAIGFGGSGSGAAAGAGEGGIAHLYLYDQSNSVLSLGGGAMLRSAGWGGNHLNGGLAGAAVADIALLQIQPDMAGGSIVSAAPVALHTAATGGTSLLAGGVGGEALVTRGAQATVNSGVLDIAGDLALFSLATGGAGSLVGGNASGTRAHLDAASGSLVSVQGNFFADAVAQGGAADLFLPDSRGGTASSRHALLTSGLRPDAPDPLTSATLAGQVRIEGQLWLQSLGRGGQGRVGGNGTGGLAEIASRWSMIESGGVSLDASGSGGAAGPGGTGGAGFGGDAGIVAVSSAAGPAFVTLGDVALRADGHGGGPAESAGGGLTLANAGTANGVSSGSQGGPGTGGRVRLFAGAGNGTLQTGAAALSATGQGGRGGSGSNGGAGGSGGAGAGGRIVAGISAGPEAFGNSASATLGPLHADASGLGGPGGEGVSGPSGMGPGGAGGAGHGGRAILSAFQGHVRIAGAAAAPGDVTLVASGLGGNGGSGQSSGAGGNALAGGQGGIAIHVGQPLAPTIPGPATSLTAGSVTGIAEAAGGSGSTTGSARIGASPLQVDIRNGLADVRNLHLSSLAPDGELANPGLPGFINLSGASLAVAGDLQVRTSGTQLVRLDSATLTTAGLALSAANFIPVLPVAASAVSGALAVLAAAPENPGTIQVRSQPGHSVVLATGLDFRTSASFDMDMPGDLTAPGSIQIGNYRRPGGRILAEQTIEIGDISVRHGIVLDAGGDITLGRVEAGQAPGLSATSGQPGISLTEGQSMASSPLAGDGTVEIRSGAHIGTGDIVGSLLTVRAGQSIATGSLNVAGPIVLAGLPAFQAGSASAASGAMSRVAGPIAISGSVTAGRLSVLGQGPISTAGLAIGGALELDSLDRLDAGSITAGTVELASGGDVDVSDIVSGGFVRIAAAGDGRLGNVSAGAASASLQAPGELRIGVGGSLVSGRLEAGLSAVAAAVQSLTVASAAAGADIALLAGGSVSSGSLTAGSGGGGTIIVGHHDMLARAGGLSDLSLSDLFSAGLEPVGGTAGLSGASTAARVDLAARGDIMAGRLSAAQSLHIDSGGMVTVAGPWAAPDITIGSHDLVLSGTSGAAGAGALDAGSDGAIRLVSRNAHQAFLGDAGPGAGMVMQAGAWHLSADEASRLRTGRLSLVARDNGGSAADLLIGNLALSSSPLVSATGWIDLATGDLASQVPAGSILIAGAVALNGLGAANGVRFRTGTFSLDASRASLVLGGQGAEPGGRMIIEADHIRVAQEAVLERLRADPAYEGRIADLNRPAAVGQAGGVLRALELQLRPGRSLHIQNTGTLAVPAGFLAGLTAGFIEPASPAAGAGVDVIVSGAFTVSGALATGTAAAEAFFAATRGRVQGLSASSQINGCSIPAGACPLAVEPSAGLASQFQALAPVMAAAEPAPVAGDEPDDVDEVDEVAADQGAEPITPPAPLFDVRGLDRLVPINGAVTGRGKSLPPVAGARAETE